LLYKPDRNRGETKALEAACSETGLSAAHLLESAAPSARRTTITCSASCSNSSRAAPLSRREPPALPVGPAACRRTRLFDRRRDDHRDRRRLFAADAARLGWRVGIHIAAPSLGIAPGSPLDDIARERLSTVYMPGSKITMLPDTAVERFTLSSGRDCPAVSLYLTVTPEFEITATSRASKSCRSSPTCAITTSSRCSTSRRLPMACPSSLFATSC
jgi:exoribonuclease-2